MGHPTWVYHRELPPNIIDSDDFESAKALGWSDTPATFLTPNVEIVEPTLDTPKPTCKKCGKVFERGLFMHEKYCKG